MTQPNNAKPGAAKARQRERFAGYPSADAYEIQYRPKLDANGKKIYETNDDGSRSLVPDTGKPVRDKLGQEVKKKAKKNGQLPWGFVVKDTGERRDWVERKQKVTYAACRRRRGGSFERDPVWIREDQLQDNRCLEVVFVDIGQGDGCFVVTPDNKRMVIDAGEHENMRHYLNWRHGSDKKTRFEAAIISHPDADHYEGFARLFERDNFFFETIYTNGLMERYEPETKKKLKEGEPRQTTLGPVQKVDGESLVTDLVTTKAELKKFLAGEKSWMKKRTDRENNAEKKKTGKMFPTMLNEALEGWKVATRRPRGEPEYVEEFKGQTVGDFRILSADDGYMPGYEKDKELSIQVLGPVTEKVAGRPALRWLESSVGKTKNGHSVVLRLQFGNVSMMLGGDLNIPSEHLLMSHHTGMASPPEPEQESAFIEAAREVFQVDIAKSCHHGSSDFTHFFLRALNPIATVISSGDDEPHSHPRSDTLGTVGYYSRCQPRPLIFSTELARSSKDSNAKPWELRSEIMHEVENILSAKTEKSRQNRKEKLKQKLVKDIPRSVAVYGAITVATDGEKVVIYQKLERKGSHGAYDIYRLEPSGKDGKGPLMYVSKH
jgi:beta-lactamase superfamily II metal-dependent hydrolase